MKKILALILALPMLTMSMSLVACDDEGSDSTGDEEKVLEQLDGKTPEELYAATQEKLKGQDNYTMVATQVVTLTVGEEEMKINQSVTSLMDGKNSYVKVENDMDSSSNQEAWYVDEMYYAIQGTKKVRAELSWETYEKDYLPSGGKSESALLNIPDTWFKDTTFQKDGDEYYLEFLVSGEEYTKYLDSFSQFNQANVEVGDVSYKVYFDADANLGDVITEFDYTVSGIEAHAVSTAKISKVGETTITVPEGAESWTLGTIKK